MNHRKENSHPDYSSSCIKLGCSFCKINRNVTERIFRFTRSNHLPQNYNKHSSWTPERRAKMMGLKIKC